ncbi:hypothetical protein T06_7246 [Trichinella sp. T6]|nr:hypothetical protein T06_7246 [Trichinella sp. T6]
MGAVSTRRALHEGRNNEDEEEERIYRTPTGT